MKIDGTGAEALGVNGCSGPMAGPDQSRFVCIEEPDRNALKIYGLAPRDAGEGSTRCRKAPASRYARWNLRGDRVFAVTHRSSPADSGFRNRRSAAGAGNRPASRGDRGRVSAGGRLQPRRHDPGLFHQLHVVPALPGPGNVVEKEEGNMANITQAECEAKGFNLERRRRRPARCPEIKLIKMTIGRGAGCDGGARAVVLKKKLPLAVRLALIKAAKRAETVEKARGGRPGSASCRESPVTRICWSGGTLMGRWFEISRAASRSRATASRSKSWRHSTGRASRRRAHRPGSAARSACFAASGS